jgi:regulator of sirC expression with transglutaminase-like and TPR domain
MQGLRAVNALLYDELGMSGNQQDYYDPRNSYLNEVLDRRLGIPISLAVLQMDVAQRAGLPLQGVSFPGHFLVSMAVEGGLLVLDPYHRGRSVDAQELKSRAKAHVGDQDIQDDQLSELLTPATNRAILTRMLRNLKALYAEKEDWPRALRCADRLLTLESDQPAELRDRGLLYLRVGHVSAGREDLNRYLARVPPPDDAAKVRESLVEAGRERGRLNSGAIDRRSGADRLHLDHLEVGFGYPAIGAGPGLRNVLPASASGDAVVRPAFGLPVEESAYHAHEDSPGPAVGAGCRLGHGSDSAGSNPPIVAGPSAVKKSRDEQRRRAPARALSGHPRDR